MGSSWNDDVRCNSTRHHLHSDRMDWSYNSYRIIINSIRHHGKGHRMKVYALMGGIDCEGENVLVTLTDKSEVDELLKEIEFVHKMTGQYDDLPLGIDGHYDYYYIKPIDVYTSREQFQAEQDRLEKLNIEKVFETKSINNPFIEALGDIK